MNDIENMIKNYLKCNLSIETKKVGGDYGSKSFTVIELKLGNEVISETYLDD